MKWLCLFLVFSLPVFGQDSSASVPAKEDAPESIDLKPLPKKTGQRLLVLDLVDLGAGINLATSMTDIISGQALKSFAGEVITATQLRLALDASADQQLAGCDSEKCFTDIGEQVEADRVLGGSVAKAGDHLILILGIVDPASGESFAQIERKIPLHKDLYYYATKEVTSKLLTGSFVDPRVPIRFESVPPGADIHINGALAGKSPLTTKLDPGNHDIEFLFTDFTPWKSRIRVEEAAPSKVSATLLQKRIALWPYAIVFGALAVGASAGGGAMSALAVDAYDGSMNLSDEPSYRELAPANTFTLRQKEQEVRQMELGANILYGAAGAFAAVAIALGATELAQQGGEE